MQRVSGPNVRWALVKAGSPFASGPSISPVLVRTDHTIQRPPRLSRANAPLEHAALFGRANDRKQLLAHGHLLAPADASRARPLPDDLVHVALARVEVAPQEAREGDRQPS